VNENAEMNALQVQRIERRRAKNGSEIEKLGNINQTKFV
jgi:hypothetical protein